MTEGYNFTPKYYYINLINSIDTLNFIASPVTDVREENTYEGLKLNLIVNNDYLDFMFIVI